MLYNGPLEPTAVSRIHPSLPVLGRGLSPFAGNRRTAGHPAAGAPDSGQATDATGLSLSPDDLAAALEAMEREQSERAPEMAYLAAGARAGRAPLAGEASAGSGSMVSAAASQAAPPASDTVNARAGGLPAHAQVQPDANSDPQADSAEARSATRTFMGGTVPSSENAGDGTAGLNQRLSDEEKDQVEELKDRDKEVRAHEQAHLGASGGLAMGGASFEQQRGPDGRMYAVGGEVQIDTSEGGTPDETIAKAQRIRSAALAPAQPSGQDRQVAAQASRMESEARQEKTSGEDEENTGPAGAPADTDVDAGSSSGRLSMRMEQARTAYARAAGNFSLAPWGTGISYAV